MTTPQNPLSPGKMTRMTTQLCAVIAVVLAALAGTQATTRAQAQAPKRTVIRPGRILDVRTGELRANLAVVIEGEKITQVAPSSEVKAGAGDATIDLPDATLLPGLIDMHTHLTFDLNSLGYQGIGFSTARATLARKIMRTSHCAMPSTMET